MSFTYTDEQLSIRESPLSENVFIKAGAGTGKSSTMLMLCELYKHMRILYLCFNRSVKEEFEFKCKKLGLTNVKAMTINGLAYGWIVKLGYKIGAYQSLTAFSASKLIDLPRLDYNFKEIPTDKIYYHIANYFEKFCISKERDISKFNYEKTLTSFKSKYFFELYESHIRTGAYRIWTMMFNREIDITQSFSMKAYQLSGTKITAYNMIFVDECQDLSELMADIIENQISNPAIKKIVAVGDTHQKIYGFLGTVDLFKILGNRGFSSYTLSSCFRFPQKNADVCQKALDEKLEYFPEYINDRLELKGLGSEIENPKTHAIIGRTNNSLFTELIQLIDSFDSVYIEGGLESLTTFDSFKLSDILCLKEEEFDSIENKFLRWKFKSLDQLREYADDTDSISLNNCFKMIDAYSTKDLFYALDNIQRKLSTDSKNVDVVLTTAHKSKGLEFDFVYMLNDFRLPFKLETKDFMGGDLPEEIIERNKRELNESFNLLYVLLSRSRDKIQHPYGDLIDVS